MRNGLMNSRYRWHVAASIDAVVPLVTPMDALVVSGFWRSGTTWVQEAVCGFWDAKSVFEPTADESGSSYNEWLKSLGLGLADRSSFMPMSLEELDGRVMSYLDASLTARRGSRFAMYCRESIFESLLPRVVLKDVRIQGILSQFVLRNNTKCIHVWRNPERVIESLLSLNWAWSFSDVSFEVQQRVHERLSRVAGDEMKVLLPFDDSAVARIAALWAYSERCVADAAKRCPGRFVIARYEDLQDVRNADAIPKILNAFGLKADHAFDFGRPSQSSREFVGATTQRYTLSEQDKVVARKAIEAIFPERLGEL